MKADIPDDLREAVEFRDHGRCSYCGLVQNGQGSKFHIDHIRPKSKGGPTELANLALQCPNCSAHKAAKTEAADPITGSRGPLFHPVKQDWAAHFRLEESGKCVGLTPTGRLTVVALQMNEDHIRRARMFQLREKRDT